MNEQLTKLIPLLEVFRSNSINFMLHSANSGVWAVLEASDLVIEWLVDSQIYGIYSYEGNWECKSFGDVLKVIGITNLKAI